MVIVEWLSKFTFIYYDGNPVCVKYFIDHDWSFSLTNRLSSSLLMASCFFLYRDLYVADAAGLTGHG